MAYCWPCQRALSYRQQHNKLTHPDNNRLFPWKLGNVSVASDHFGAVQGPKTAHHFDGALRRVGHLPRFTNGNSPIKNKVYPGSQERPWGAKREAEPLCPNLRFWKGRLSVVHSTKILVFLSITSPSCYEAMIPVDQRLATSPLLLLWMWFTMTSPRRSLHTCLCCCNEILNNQ